MTFSILACADGLLGVAIASSPMAVGARCPQLRPGVGVATSQGNTDPALGLRMLDLLAGGATPQAAIEALRGTPFFESRQLGLVDAQGRVAVHAGTTTEPHNGALVGDGFAVLGNHLSTAEVLPAMRDAFLARHDAPFEIRLMAALAAGRDAGGDRSGCRSAAIRVAGTAPQPRTDLRVDWRPADGGEDAVDGLAAMLRRWLPLIPYYARRPMDPSVGDWEAWSPAPSQQNQGEP